MSAKVVMMVFPYRGIEGMGLDDLELAEPVVWDRHIDFGAMGHQTLACRKIECGVGFRAFRYHEGFPFKEVGKIAHKHWYCLWASPVSKACR